VYSQNLSLSLVYPFNHEYKLLGNKASSKQKASSAIDSMSWQLSKRTSEPDAKVVKSVFVADVGWSSQVK
jgi:hypothetical protein